MKGNFLQCLLCIYGDNHTVCIHQLVKLVYYLFLFVHVEPSLHVKHKFYLIWASGLSDVLLDFISVSLRIFPSIFIKDIDESSFLSSLSFFGLVIKVDVGLI